MGDTEIVEHLGGSFQEPRRETAAIPLFAAEYCLLPCLRRQSTLQFGVRTGANLEGKMGEPSLGTPPSERPLEDRLDSWKEIAAYLKRDVTTVQRWEKREAMCPSTVT